jgi:hypothetical protein
MAIILKNLLMQSWKVLQKRLKEKEWVFGDTVGLWHDLMEVETHDHICNSVGYEIPTHLMKLVWSQSEVSVAYIPGARVDYQKHGSAEWECWKVHHPLWQPSRWRKDSHIDGCSEAACPDGHCIPAHGRRLSRTEETAEENGQRNLIESPEDEEFQE